jgi:benzoate membrane transport protein
MRNFPVSAITAGFIAVLVGYTGSAAIIFQAATSAGANEQMIASWMCILGIAMGITTIGLSLYYRAPVLTAWSTPGAAVLVTSLAGFTMAEAIGAFVFSAGLIVLFGVTGWFEKIMDLIPFAIVSALLAGVLGKFGIDVFISMQSSWQLVLPMFVSYLVFKLFTKTYVVPLVFLFAMVLAAVLGMSSYSKVGLSVSKLIWTTPEFSFAGILTIAVPLFVVTMASQNIPGVGVLRANGYKTPVSPIISWTGLTTLLLAPFGCFAINYAAITAAICAGEGAHPDKEKRYIASVSAGVFYLLTGIFAATFVALFAAFPEALVLAIAGIALLSTIANSMKQAMVSDEHREPALVTFLVTLSGMTLWGIGAAFWGIVFGLLTLLVLQPRRGT